MKQLLSHRSLVIPDGVEIVVKARKVRVKGPRGEWGRARERGRAQPCSMGSRWPACGPPRSGDIAAGT